MRSDGEKKREEDAARAVKFMAIKFLVFGLLPVLVAAIIVYWQLG